MVEKDPRSRTSTEYKDKKAPLTDARCKLFADYPTDNYVSQDSRFPPHLWAEPPSDTRRTTNGPE